VRAIHQKLVRDLWHMRGAVITIALVVAAGVSAYVTLHGTWLSIVRARDRYYTSERFGDVFAQFERAPLVLVDKIARLPDVARVYPRVVGSARIPLAQLGEPAQARVISLPTHDEPLLNGVRVVVGRAPNPDRDDEALLIEMFAERHGLKAGATLNVIIEGRERTIRVVGIAMSPEFVLSVPAGSGTPAPERFAVLWMPKPAVEAAYDMAGAFNDVTLDLSPHARTDAVVKKLDLLLRPYGSLGAVARDRQASHYYLTQDLAQLESMATLAPIIFLGVAAFLLNVVLSRFVELDRPQIATLKALGYDNRAVGLHYVQVTLLISLVGGALGLAAGSVLGRYFTGMYVEWYRMPGLHYLLDARLATSAILVGVGAGLLGSALAVRRVIKLPPAEAMRPAAPARYRRGFFARLVEQLLTSSARITMREIMRRPARTLMSAMGVAACTGILVVGQFFSDAMAYLIDFYMQTAQRETLAVSFTNPLPDAAVHALATLDGVLDVQWQATRQVRVRAGHHERIVGVIGRPERRSLRPLLDDQGREVALAEGGALFTEMLAKVLDIKPGEAVEVAPITGDPAPRTIIMRGTVPELMGLWIHLESADFHTLLRQAPQATDALLVVDRNKTEHVQDELNDMPNVMSVMRKEVAIAEFRKNSGSMFTFSLVLTLFAVTIAVSVVYNNARVALSLRARELASLRVLGFTRAEISRILLGELSAQVLLGVPLGLAFGRMLVAGMLAANDPETFRLPPLVSAHTYAFAAAITLGAAVASALLVRRQLDKLDLVEVLKMRE
jgi:putative ABC transport system permease protein